MKLAQLFSIYSQLRWGENQGVEVSSVQDDSRLVTSGSVYVALRGHSSDGHNYISQAIEKGAIAVVAEDFQFFPKDYTGSVVLVQDSRRELHRLASRFYGDVAEKMFCFGVTGTNGKTSITYMVEHLLGEFGLPTGVMGTVNHHFGSHVWGSEHTTPPPALLHKRLQEFSALGAKAVAFEVSSHALSQQRVHYLPFDVVAFTNLTRDHLDYHETMENYFQEKEKLFTEVPCFSGQKRVHAIVNADDPWGRKIRLHEKVKRLTYGVSGADFCLKVDEMDFNGTRFRIQSHRGDWAFQSPLIGVHNVYNFAAALITGVIAGASADCLQSGVSCFRGVPGRLERVPNKRGVHCFVDYAHTDDALRTVLQTLDSVRKAEGSKARLICVFGCGGDRDRGKRPLMAQAAAQGADRVVLTSDNPRNEDPLSIIQETLQGVGENVRRERFEIEPDRRKAISFAVQWAKPGDVILIAGKGHETYQQVGNERLPFSDVNVAREALA